MSVVPGVASLRANLGKQIEMELHCGSNAAKRYNNGLLSREWHCLQKGTASKLARNKAQASLRTPNSSIEAERGKPLNRPNGLYYIFINSHNSLY
jgi:hypothetical protein